MKNVDDRHLLLVRMEIPSGIPNLPPGFFPDGNGGGLLLLSLLLWRALERAGQVRGAPRRGSLGELNSGFLLFEAEGWSVALGAIQAELDLCGLLGFSMLARFDLDECVWRCYYPRKFAGDAMLQMPDLRTLADAIRAEHIQLQSITGGDSAS